MEPNPKPKDFLLVPFVGGGHAPRARPHVSARTCVPWWLDEGESREETEGRKKKKSDEKETVSNLSSYKRKRGKRRKEFEEGRE
jgi:hypothetical protein